MLNIEIRCTKRNISHLSPAAAEGNDPNRSGCFGKGDSLTLGELWEGEIVTKLA
jgi:hypothetical protein